MDNPWANAWGDSSKETEPKPWTTAHKSHDSETDIALPSWSTGAAIKWAEPSEDHQASLWTDLNSESQWEPKQSPYENLLNANKSTLEESVPEQSTLEETTHGELEEVSTHVEPVLEPPSPEVIVHQGFAHQEHASPPVTPPDSPDPFGTFETGLDQPEDSPLDPWGNPVGSNTWAYPQDTQSDELVDEWEAAKLQKQKQDRHVVSFLSSSTCPPLIQL